MFSAITPMPIGNPLREHKPNMEFMPHFCFNFIRSKKKRCFVAKKKKNKEEHWISSVGVPFLTSKNASSSWLLCIYVNNNHLVSTEHPFFLSFSLYLSLSPLFLSFFLFLKLDLTKWVCDKERISACKRKFNFCSFWWYVPKCLGIIPQWLMMVMYF